MQDEVQDYGILIAKKSERLVSALYLVTDLMTDQEPIKHSLRMNAVTLLSSMNSLSQLNPKDRYGEFRRSLKAVSEMISLLHVAHTTAIVSDMNGRLLMDGFRSLEAVLEKKQPIITKEMLEIDRENELTRGTGEKDAIRSTSYDALTPRTLSHIHSSEKSLKSTENTLRQERLLNRLTRPTPGSDINKRQLETNKMSYIRQIEENKGETSRNNVSYEMGGRTANRGNTEVSGVSSEAFISSFQQKKQSRRDQILSLFVRGVDVSIKDIAARIRGCSEKTIQRELNSLLDSGLIERIGEKRWSRYILK